MIAAIVFVTLGVGVSVCLDCSQFFVQESRSPIPNRWYGSLKLVSQQNLNGVWLKLEFDRKVQQLGSWFGEVQAKDHENLEFLIKDHRYHLKANVPESVRFYVQYNKEQPAPQLVSYRLNGKNLCSKVVVTAPVRVGGLVDDECGTVVQATPLITYGSGVLEGMFPWHVAVFHENFNYACGGSLVSPNYVLTAGHCVFKRNRQRVSENEITVQLGKHFLSASSSSNVQQRLVSEVKLHPRYNSSNYRNDIALLKLSTPANIDESVRTICLRHYSQESISEGIVVGWGIDETGVLTEELMQTTMPIVSQDKCIFSNPEFYSRFTSENTFCAGHRNGTSACNGDSGGSMAFYADRKWYIRGIVSLAVPLPNFMCDSFNYVVFTDVFKYLDWLKESMID